MKPQIVCEMKGRRGLCTSALEIRYCQNLKMLSRTAARQESGSLRRLLLCEQMSYFIDLGESIGSMIIFEPSRDRPLTLDRHNF